MEVVTGRLENPLERSSTSGPTAAIGDELRFKKPLVRAYPCHFPCRSKEIRTGRYPWSLPAPRMKSTVSNRLGAFRPSAVLSPRSCRLPRRPKSMLPAKADERLFTRFWQRPISVQEC